MKLARLLICMCLILAGLFATYSQASGRGDRGKMRKAEDGKKNATPLFPYSAFDTQEAASAALEEFFQEFGEEVDAEAIYDWVATKRLPLDVQELVISTVESQQYFRQFSQWHQAPASVGKYLFDLGLTDPVLYNGVLEGEHFTIQWVSALSRPTVYKDGRALRIAVTATPDRVSWETTPKRPMKGGQERGFIAVADDGNLILQIVADDIAYRLIVGDLPAGGEVSGGFSLRTGGAVCRCFGTGPKGTCTDEGCDGGVRCVRSCRWAPGAF